MGLADNLEGLLRTVTFLSSQEPDRLVLQLYSAQRSTVVSRGLSLMPRERGSEVVKQSLSATAYYGVCCALVEQSQMH